MIFSQFEKTATTSGGKALEQEAHGNVGNRVLTLEGVAQAANSILDGLRLSDSVEPLDAPTIKYYRRSAVGILSPPETSMGGYRKQHVLEALAARLGGASLGTTLKESAKAIAAARKTKDPEAALIEHTGQWIERLWGQIAWEAKSERYPHNPQICTNTPTTDAGDVARAVNQARGQKLTLTWSLPGGGMLMLPQGYKASGEEKEQILGLVQEAIGV